MERLVSGPEPLEPAPLRELADRIASERPPMASREPRPGNPYEALRQDLAFRTVLFARKNVPHYRDALGSVESVGREEPYAELLRRLPILRKAQLRAEPRQFVNPHVSIIGVRRTSGTSAQGTPLPICISMEEAEALNAMRRMVHRMRGAPRASPSLTIYTERIPPFQGTPNSFSLSQSWSGTPESIQWIVQELFYSFPTPRLPGRVSQLILPMPSMLRPITNAVRTHGLDPRDSAVRMILTAGGFATKAIRSIAKAEWDADFYNSYAMGELGVAALECVRHEMHFGLTVIPEVVDPATGHPLPEGTVGVLLLTTLYPFQQATPLIRYYTGDIMSITSEPCPCGFPGPIIKRFVGREDYSQRIGDPGSSSTWISPFTSKEVLESEASKFGFDKYGRLRFFHELARTPANGATLRVHVELSQAASFGTQGKTEALRKKLEGELGAAHAADVGPDVDLGVELVFRAPSLGEAPSPFFYRT